jgi:hypothetical protein
MNPSKLERFIISYGYGLKVRISIASMLQALQQQQQQQNSTL